MVDTLGNFYTTLEETPISHFQSISPVRQEILQLRQDLASQRLDGILPSPGKLLGESLLRFPKSQARLARSLRLDPSIITYLLKGERSFQPNWPFYDKLVQFGIPEDEVRNILLTTTDLPLLIPDEGTDLSESAWIYGNHLALHRIKLGISQSELGRELGFDASYINRIEIVKTRSS